MYLGRVVGTVVATRKYEGLEGVKLLFVQPLDWRVQPAGTPHVAVDTVRAGEGDLVYLVGSREASLALEPKFVPVDAAIVGIVDELDIVSTGGPSPPAPSGKAGRGPTLLRVAPRATDGAVRGPAEKRTSDLNTNGKRGR